MKRSEKVIIREAELVDAPGIAKVHVDSWRTTYKNIMSDDFLSHLSYEQRTKLWEKTLYKKIVMF